MSTSVSLDASMSATPPAHKMNGGLSSRHLLNVSTLSTSKHSQNTATTTLGTPSGGPAGTSPVGKPLLDLSRTSIHPSLNLSRRTEASTKGSGDPGDKSDHGIYQMLASLALLCLLSLLMSFLALFFLQRIGPMAPPDADKNGGNIHHQNSGVVPKRIVITKDEYVTVYQVSVAMSTLTISLNLCCLFVCCIQFLFTIKLMKTPNGEERTNKFLKRSSHTRVVAIAGFFLSIPIFFTGVILFTFIHFHEVPAIATSIVIGIGIVFCGVASVHNVYLWQWEKTCASKELAESRLSNLRDSAMQPDLTHTIELSTLV